tara:strand:- start:994 stop:1260 length:267 start_codon:yes stop_codon:yes gene_type:complete
MNAQDRCATVNNASPRRIMDDRDKILEAKVVFNKRLIKAVQSELQVADMSGNGLSLIQQVMLKLCRDMSQGAVEVSITPSQETIKKFR